MHCLPHSNKRFALSICECVCIFLSARNGNKNLLPISLSLSMSVGLACLPLHFTEVCHPAATHRCQHLQTSIWESLSLLPGPSTPRPVGCFPYLCLLICTSRSGTAVNKIKCSETETLNMRECRSAFFTWRRRAFSSGFHSANKFTCTSASDGDQTAFFLSSFPRGYRHQLFGWLCQPWRMSSTVFSFLKAASHWKQIRGFLWRCGVCQSPPPACRITEARKEVWEGGGKVIFTLLPPAATLRSSAPHAQTFWESCCMCIRTVLCACVCGVCMKDWCWPKYLPSWIRPGTHWARQRRGGERERKREGDRAKEQMPQIETPINNAASTELSGEGGGRGKVSPKEFDYRTLI